MQKTENNILKAREKGASAAGIIIILFVVISTLIVGYFMFRVYREKQVKEELARKAETERIREENKRKKEQATADEEKRRLAKLEKKKQAWEKAMKYAEEHKKDPGLVLAYFVKIKRFTSGSEYEELIEKEIERLKEEVNNRPPPPSEKEGKNSAALAKLMNEDQVDDAFKKAEIEKAATKDFEKMMPVIAELVLEKQYAKALELAKKFSANKDYMTVYGNRISNICDSLSQMASFEDDILKTFQAQAGKVVQIDTENGPIKAKISGAKEGKIYYENKYGKLSLNYDDLTLKEKMKRFNPRRKETKALFLALAAIDKTKFDTAMTKFLPYTDEDLSVHISNKIRPIWEKQMKAANPDNYKIQTEEKETEKDEKTADGKTGTENIDPEKIDLKVVTRKPRKNSRDGDYDNKVQTIVSRVSVKNRNQDAIKNYKVKWLIIGENASTRNKFAVMDLYNQEGITVDSYKTADTEEHSLTTKYDDNDMAKFGYKYEGYVVYLMDENGKNISTKASSSKLKKITDKLSEFEKNTVFDDKGGKLGVEYYGGSY